MRNLLRLFSTGMTVLRREGLRSFLWRTRRRITQGVTGRLVHMPVTSVEAVEVDWSEPAARLDRPIVVSEGPVEIAWIMSPPSATSGGHQNLFRFIRYAELGGHRCSVYFYNNVGVTVDIGAMREMLDGSAAYPSFDAKLANYDSDVGLPSTTQAVFATGWETAYPAYLDATSARRFYFVQDFEPAFYPAGSEATFAENTYRFGFHGITAGGWLSHKLHAEYGMPTDHFDFASDPVHYNLVNLERRDEVFFYVRPPTARRGFELGVLAMADFAESHPDSVINLAGWDVSDWRLPFTAVNHSGMRITELNDLYNRCAAGLVLSMSNMSLLPLELMSAGVTPVVNDAPNNRMVVDSPFIEYAAPTPRALSRALADAVDRSDQIPRAVGMSEAAGATSWDESGRQFLAAFERTMRG